MPSLVRTASSSAVSGTDIVIPLLERCWYLHRNPVWLFPSVGRGGIHGAVATSPVPLGTVQQVFRAALAVSGVHKFQ